MMIGANLARAISIAIVSLIMVASGQTAISADDVPTRDGVFEIQLETNQQVYKVGEPIFVNLAIKNYSNETVTIGAIPACQAVTIDVQDIKQGKVPGNFHGCPVHLDASAYQLPPGTSHQLYSIDVVHARKTMWTNLDAFGYSIDKPGTYNISASPLFDGFEYAKGRLTSRFHVARVPCSNVVRIRVQ